MTERSRKPGKIVDPDAPVTDRNNGRGPGGRFAKGNTCAKGRRTPTAAAREAFRSAVGAGDLKRIARRLLRAADGGDVPAMRELLDRTMGRPRQEAPETVLEIDPAALTDRGDIARALTEIAAAVAAGQLDRAEAGTAASALRAAAVLGGEAIDRIPPDWTADLPPEFL